LIFLLRRFREVLTGDPNAPVGGLGPPIPPLYSCKKLESSLKKAVPTISCFNPDFTAKTQFPLSKADESTPFLGKNLNQKSPLKMQNQSKSPIVRAPKASTRTADP
jgi:hypothetical protein